MRTQRTLFALAAVAVGLLAACGDAPTQADDGGRNPVPEVARDAEAPFQTDSLAYTPISGVLGHTLAIGVEFTNRTGAAVYFPLCNDISPVRLEKLVGGEWREAWPLVGEACDSEPMATAPGGKAYLRLGLVWGLPGSEFDARLPLSELDGVYRLVWSDLRSWPDAGSSADSRLPLAQRISNRFVMRAPRR